MNFFDDKNLENHVLQLFPKVVKHPVYTMGCPLSNLFEVCLSVDIRSPPYFNHCRHDHQGNLQGH